MSSEHGAYDGMSASAALPERHEARFSRALVFTIMLSLILGLVWASATPIDEVIAGNGVIKTSAEVESVEHQYGGVVTELYTQRGDQVTAGQRVLAFDDGQLSRELEKLRATQSALDAEWRRIDFVLSSAPLDWIDEEVNPNSIETQLFQAEQSYLLAQLNLISSEEKEISETIESLQFHLDNLGEELGILRDRRKRYRSFGHTGVFSEADSEALERQIIQLERSELNVRRELGTQQRALSTSELRRTELLAARRREAVLRRAEIEEQQAVTEQDIAEIESRIERSEVRASVNGTILNLFVSYPGQVVAPGDQIAEIVLSDSALVAEVEIPADRLGSIKPGMEARVKVTSYDFTRFGSITGPVLSISPSSVLNSVQVPVFKVIISLPSDGPIPELAGRPLRAGMTLTADILSERKTVLSYLLKPLRALGDRAFSEA